MNFLYLQASALWPWVVVFTFGILIVRIALWCFSILASQGCIISNSGRAIANPVENLKSGLKASASFVVSMGRSLLPGHAFLKVDPVYVIHRMAFHFCLFASIFCLSFHLYAWQETLPSWMASLLPETEIPDSWIEHMALFVLFSTLYFPAKRWLALNRNGKKTTYGLVLCLVTIVPFATGYFSMTGYRTAIDFIDNNLFTMHIISGEIFLVYAAFLMARTCIDPDSCTGCLACANRCPTGALTTSHTETTVQIHYSPSDCIHCGTCMVVCDDRAIALKHVFGLPTFRKKTTLNGLALVFCSRCGNGFASGKQIEKLHKEFVGFDLGTCPECRSIGHAKTHRNLLSGNEFPCDRQIRQPSDDLGHLPSPEKTAQQAHEHGHAFGCDT